MGKGSPHCIAVYRIRDRRAHGLVGHWHRIWYAHTPCGFHQQRVAEHQWVIPDAQGKYTQALMMHLEELRIATTIERDHRAGLSARLHIANVYLSRNELKLASDAYMAVRASQLLPLHRVSHW
jgi:hypothetical protein